MGFACLRSLIHGGALRTMLTLVHGLHSVLQMLSMPVSVSKCKFASNNNAGTCGGRNTAFDKLLSKA